MGSRPWLFGVTWRHRSRDYSTRGGRLPMGGPLWPCVYLALLWRYGASNVGSTDVETERKKKGKEKVKGKKKEREGEGKRRKGKGKGKWKGKGKETEKEKGKGKGNGRRRRKKESLRKVGRTDAWTLRWFYTLSNAMHWIGQTTTCWKTWSKIWVSARHIETIEVE